MALLSQRGSCGGAVQLVVGSFLAVIVPYIDVDLVCPWEGVQDLLTLPSWTASGPRGILKG